MKRSKKLPRTRRPSGATARSKQRRAAPASRRLTPQQELLLFARDGARSFVQVLLAFVVLGGLAGGAWALWSVRPAPSYSSEGLATGSPFDVTFKVENENPWFALSNLSITCVVDHIRASGVPPTAAPAKQVRFPSSGTSLEPGQSATFTCPFRDVIGHTMNDDPDIVRRSEVYFRAEYDVPLLQSFRISANSAHFAFDTRLLPPRWVPKP